MNEKIYVWTDGSVITKNSHNRMIHDACGWAAMIKHPFIEAQLTGSLVNKTSPYCEVTAAIRALEAIVEARRTRELPDKVVIFSDLQYLINCRTTLLNRMLAVDWKKKGRDVPNADLFRNLDQLEQELTVQWVKIKAHNNIWENEIVDWLSKHAAHRSLPIQISKKIKRPQPPRIQDCIMTNLQISSDAMSIDYARSLKTKDNEYSDPVLRAEYEKEQRLKEKKSKHRARNKLNRKARARKRAAKSAKQAKFSSGANFDFYKDAGLLTDTCQFESQSVR